VLPTADDSSEDLSNDRKDGAHSATTSARGKDLVFQSRLGQDKQLRRVLPTVKNRSTKSSPRDFSQCLHFDAFTFYARHQLPENIDEILVIVESVTTNVTSQHSGSTNCMSQLNSEVSSWNTKRQIVPSSSSIFNESIGDSVFPLNRHMISELIILIILKPLLQIQNYCKIHYQAMMP
jgi:hypothetical protein